MLVAASTALLMESADLIDLGGRLRDLSQPQRIWQARAVGLRQEFPRLRTLDAAGGNLPSQSTSFLGREHDITDRLFACVTAYLEQDVDSQGAYRSLLGGP